MHPSLEDLLLIIPLYDKYQFLALLRYCDIFISKDILDGNLGGYYDIDMGDNSNDVKAARLAVGIFGIQSRLLPFI